MESLRTDGLSKEFGKLVVLKDVSILVNKGECRAIIGPNGAGKTTFFNLLTGHLVPSAGRIYFFGEEMTAMPLHRRVRLGLARTFQVTNLMFNLSVLDNVQLATKAMMPIRYGMLRPEEKYGSLLEQSRSLLGQWGLWEKRNHRVKDLAYGEQRLMELIMALASKPKVLLLDEPTSGLSESEASSFVGIIREAKQDNTLIIVEHHMDVVFDLADSITVLHYGEVIAEGTTEDIRKNPKVKEVYLGEDK